MAEPSRPLLPHVGFWGRHKRRRLRLHRNPGLELVLVTAGSPLWLIGERVEQVHPGEVFFSLPWETHGGVFEREPGVEFWFVVVALDRDYQRQPQRFAFHRDLYLRPAETRRTTAALIDSHRCVVPASDALSFLIPEIVKRQRRGTTGLERGMALASLVRSAVLEVARCSVEGMEAAQGTDASQRRVARFLATLERRCGEHWTLTTMAAACGLRRTRFAELVHRLTGDSPIMALNRLRVRRAEFALRETDAGITAIAFDCGFSSTQYFARTFRAFTGRSPTGFRATQQTAAKTDPR